MKNLLKNIITISIAVIFFITSNGILLIQQYCLIKKSQTIHLFQANKQNCCENNALLISHQKESCSCCRLEKEIKKSPLSFNKIECCSFKDYFIKIFFPFEKSTSMMPVIHFEVITSQWKALTDEINPENSYIISSHPPPLNYSGTFIKNCILLL